MNSKENHSSVATRLSSACLALSLLELSGVSCSTVPSRALEASFSVQIILLCTFFFFWFSFARFFSIFVLFASALNSELRGV